MRPDEGYIFYIINPKSGSSSNKLMVNEFLDYLHNRGFDVRPHITKSLEHVRQLASEAANDSLCRLVAVAGGDGTVREAAQGLEGSEKLFLVLPCGTENLLANELGFDEKTRTIIRTFENGIIRLLDLGRANSLCFTSIAGFGFDGQVVERVTAGRSGHIRHLDYFWPIWRTFWNYKFPPVKVRIDHEDIFEGRGLVFVGNISRYSLGLQILHYAKFDDGLLDVCIYKCGCQTNLLKHAALTLMKRHAGRKDVIYRQGRNIQVCCDSGQVRTEIDGDPGPVLPVNIEVIPQAVRVIVPPDARPAGVRTRLIRMLG